MTFLAWIVLGLVAGWIASMLMGAGGYGLIGDIVVGVLGALLGGWLASTLLGLDVTGLNFTSLAIAVVGAVVLIVIYRAVAPRKRALL